MSVFFFCQDYRMQTKWDDRKKWKVAQMLMNYWRFCWRCRGRFALALQGGFVEKKANNSQNK